MVQKYISSDIFASKIPGLVSIENRVYPADILKMSTNNHKNHLCGCSCSYANYEKLQSFFTGSNILIK